MTMGKARMDLEWCPRWATVVHGSVFVAVLAGAVAAWLTAALALLVSPVQAMTSLATKGAWGVADVVRQGTAAMLGHTAARPPSPQDR